MLYTGPEQVEFERSGYVMIILSMGIVNKFERCYLVMRSLFFLLASDACKPHSTDEPLIVFHTVDQRDKREQCNG